MNIICSVAADAQLLLQVLFVGASPLGLALRGHAGKANIINPQFLPSRYYMYSAVRRTNESNRTCPAPARQLPNLGVPQRWFLEPSWTNGQLGSYFCAAPLGKEAVSLPLRGRIACGFALFCTAIRSHVSSVCSLR